MAAHSQDPILSFPAAESGRISGQAASSYILCERRCSPSGHLVTRRVEHIVGFHFHWLFCPDPVPNRGRAVDAVSVEGRGRSISRAATQYFLNPTLAFTVAPLVARKVQRLVRSFFIFGVVRPFELCVIQLTMHCHNKHAGIVRRASEDFHYHIR